MSDRNYSPYGLDDDPFLTHPAGAGQTQGRGYARENHAQVAMQPQFAAHAARDFDGYGADFAPQNGRDYPRSAPRDYNQHDYAQHHYGAPEFAARDYPQDVGYAPNPRAQANGGAQAAHYGGRYDDPYPQYDARAQRPVNPPAHPQDMRGYDPRFAPQGGDHAPPHYNQHYPQRAAQSAQSPRSYAPLPQQPLYGAAPKFGTAPRLSDHGARAVHWVGAICTVLAVLGAVYWGYALAVRDASGIPVVRAAMGPLRIAPEAPGGDITAHQGLAVNAIPAAALEAQPPQEITLAPQSGTISPADTLTESGSFAQLGGEGGAATVMGAADMAPSQIPATAQIDLTALPDALPEDMPLSDEEAVVRALEMALAEGGAFPNEAEASAPQIAEPVGMAAASPSDLAPTAPPTAEVDPASIAAGTAMVQLGAFDDAALARAEWANLQTRFAELFAAKALVVQEAQSGGRNFFRLRAHGFDSPDETRRFCAAILAENGTCLPVVQR
jgi:hypothetical protein